MCLIGLMKRQDTRLQRVGSAVTTLNSISSGAVADGKKMYFQIPLRPSCRSHCAFEFEGRRFRSRVLFFGLATATHCCQSIMEMVASNFRLRAESGKAMAMIVYVDDFFMEESLLPLFKQKCVDLNVLLNSTKELTGRR